jgi:hypothetical protein
MKRILLVCVLCAMMSAGAATAQVDQYMEMLRTDVRAEKVAVITEVMAFTDEEGELFWPIYREYELELAKLFDKRLANIKDYAEHYDAIDDEKADELLGQSFKNFESREKLLKSYYKKFKKAMGAKRAATFVMLERQINLLIDLQIAANLPLID